MRKIIGLILFLALAISVSMALADAPDIITDATSIMVNTEYSDNIDNRDDKDFFKFTLPAAGPVSVTFSHEYENKDRTQWVVTIINSNGKDMTSRWFKPNAMQAETSPSYGLPAGTYYVRINRDTGYSDYCGVKYTFKVNFSASDYWETEFNDNIATESDPILVNTEYSGNIAHKDDMDHYQFTLDQDGPISITFSHTYSAVNDTRWIVRILDNNAKVMIARYFRPNQINAITTAKLGLPAGSYYVKISRDTNYGTYDDCTYQFKINFEPSSVWETEFNNNVAYESDPIQFDVEYFGTITNNDDKDYFKFVVTEAGTVRFKFNHDYQDVIYGWTAQFLNADLGVVKSFTFGAKDTAEAINDVDLSVGSYYLLITRYTNYSSYTDATYRFVIEGPKGPDKINIADKKVTVSKINPQVYTGAPITPAFTLKYEGKTLTSGTDYTYEFSNNTSVGTAKLTIYGANDFEGERSESFVINPKAVKISSLKAGSKKLTVKWTKGTDITGYEIEYSLSKNFSGSKKVKISKASTTSTVLKKLKGKKTYYVRIRAFKKVGSKKYYSAWSKTKKKETKK